MRAIETDLPGVLLFEPAVYRDARGHFVESWHLNHYAEAGLEVSFVQDNFAFSRRGVLRGLHFQNPQPQGKLVYALEGEVFDVAVDIRAGSPTFGQWSGVTISGENCRQVYIPPGFAHGYCVTSETAVVAYKCTDFYCAAAQAAVRWNDPDLAIRWPVREPILSEKDQLAPRLRDLPIERLMFSCREPELAST